MDICYLDCGGGVLNVYMSQTYQIVTLNMYTLSYVNSTSTKLLIFLNTGKSWHTPALISYFEMPKNKILGIFWAVLYHLHSVEEVIENITFNNRKLI